MPADGARPPWRCPLLRAKEEDGGGDYFRVSDWLLKSWEIHRAPSEQHVGFHGVQRSLDVPVWQYYGLLENTAFGPEDIERLVTAYGQTLRALGLKIATTPSRSLSPRRSLRSAGWELKTRRRFPS